MMMQNDFTKQWAELSKASMESLQKMNQTNIDNFNNMLKGQLPQMGDLNLGQAPFNSLKELQEFNSATLNNFFQGQFNALNMTFMANSMKDLMEINVNTMNALIQRQVETTNVLTECTTHCIENLKDAKTPEDVVRASNENIAELQEKLRDDAEKTAEVFNQIKAAMTIWTEKTLEGAMSEVKKG